ncbi:flagellar protein FliT [Aneurinibacillus tyrosinisolvens]|uniref:flagellar protein FliT n=1 Tax=Aneurinibacillus tyrosinisolvens TaxID=1443435 RepID=UPI00063F77F3|nr:flagellar protein FliT [Aneurinibacillus tyrosinisolvens]
MGRSNEIGEKISMSVNQKRMLLERFSLYTNELEQALHAEDEELIDEYMEKREQIIQQVNELDRSVNAAEREYAEEELHSFLASLIEKDKQIKQLMEQKKESFASELRKIRASKRMHTSYNTKGYASEGFFVDKTIKSK